MRFWGLPRSGPTRGTSLTSLQVFDALDFRLPCVHLTLPKDHQEPFIRRSGFGVVVLVPKFAQVPCRGILSGKARQI
jgi:hypothetical protein